MKCHELIERLERLSSLFNSNLDVIFGINGADGDTYDIDTVAVTYDKLNEKFVVIMIDEQS